MLFANATRCYGADDQVLMLKLRHAFLGDLKRCVSQKGIACEFTALGFEYVYRIEDPKTMLMFNRESKLYYEGSANNSGTLNRASVLAGISSRTHSTNVSWGKEKWTKERFEQFAGIKCSYFETQKDDHKWQFWISKEYKLPPMAYRLNSEWMQLPNLNGLPVRAVRTNRLGRKTVVLECLAINKMPTPANFLKIPPGLRRVNDVAEVCNSKDSFLNDVLETLK